MKSEAEIMDMAEAYLLGELPPAERAEFEELRRSNPAFDQKVVAHYSLMDQLSELGARKRLLADMEDVHSQLDIAAMHNQVPKRVVVKRLWAKHRFNLAIAASVALFTLMSTLISTGYFTRNSATISDYNAMKRDINNKLERQDKIISNVQRSVHSKPVNPGHYGGTGFVLSGNYLVTSYHIVEDADSVYVQSRDGESYKARTVHTDKANDIAVLQVTDPNFPAFTSLPYSIRSSETDPGEDVFTIGFPGDKQVFGKGYVSAASGYQSDTTEYQVSIDVNPGSSGGPLVDSRGNIIGMIQAKQYNVEGAAFAKKSNYLLDVINAIPPSSLNGKIVLSKRNSLAGLSRTNQFKKLKKYIFMVKAY